jgi:GNAT superfamily N-acetyltransferase
MAIEIHYLADFPAHAPMLAQWHYDQWHELKAGDSPERRLALLHARANHRAVPTVFVAADGARLLGSATLAEHDMETRLELTPWMVDVFVAPEFRRRGIASALVKRLVREAAELGVAELYLYTTGPWRERFVCRFGMVGARASGLSGNRAGDHVYRADLIGCPASRLTMLHREG